MREREKMRMRARGSKRNIERPPSSLFQTPFFLPFPLLPPPFLPWLVGHIDVHHINTASEHLQAVNFSPADSRLLCTITHHTRILKRLIHTCHAYPFDTSLKALHEFMQGISLYNSTVVSLGQSSLHSFPRTRTPLCYSLFLYRQHNL
jgi:hypothetical protein